MIRKIAVPAALALALVVTGCGSDDDGGTTAADDPATEATENGEQAAGDCSVDALPLKEAGQLTVATGEEVFPPWVLDDDPASGEGFESALVYALAEELGFSEDQVGWTGTGFDEAIAPGEKDYDFNVQQYSITEERDQVVDFSDGYYQVEQALVGPADGVLAEASSVADLADARLGAAIGTTSLDYIEDVIQPDTPASVYNDNVDAKSALDADQIDGLVFDLPTAYYITAVEIPEASIVGVLPVEDDPEELGFLFEEGSPLVPCVNEALAALDAAGTLDSLQEEWLNDGGNIPELSS